MKLLALINANLKGFMRKRKNILLLVVFPLLLIGIIFLSFNPQGLRPVDVGYIVAPETRIEDISLTDSLGTFARLTQYKDLDSCLSQVRRTKEYVCVHIRESGPYILDTYYDNTREPVIWEIIERIKQAVQFVQQQESKEIATDFLTDFDNAMVKLSGFDSGLEGTNQQLYSSITQVDQSTTSLQNARSNLIVTLNQMDEDINEARSETASTRSAKDSYADDARTSLYKLNTPLSALSYINGSTPYVQQAYTAQSNALNEVNALDSEVENKLSNVEAKLSAYESKSAQGRYYVNDFDNGLRQLASARSALLAYQAKVDSTRNELQTIRGEFDGLQQLDADTLVNPVVIYNVPVYIPAVAGDYQEVDAQTAAKGVSLISLQTIFPMILLLITLFLSLLIGSFVALGEVNARTSIRMKLLPGLFFHEFFATLISAIVIVCVPVAVVMLIGELLFKLGMLKVIFPLSLLLILLITYFVLLGLLLAYLIRKESITLMVCTFVLVLLIFLSGFLLPIERMSPLFALIAYLNPGSIAISVFKQTVFYNVSLYDVAFSMWFLVGELAVLFVLTVAVRWFKR